jgi:hypothetical protein
MKPDEMPPECGAVGDDGRERPGVTLEFVRDRIQEGMARGRMLAAVWELPNGDVAVALAEPHANQKLITALRRTADSLAKLARPH